MPQFSFARFDRIESFDSVDRTECIERIRRPQRRLVAALAAVLPALAWAQSPAAPATQRDPLRADEPVPQQVYRSAFEAYRAVPDAPLAPWRASNEQVREIGGWRVYSREPAADTSQPNNPHRH